METDRPIDHVMRKLQISGHTGRRNSYVALCPAHDDSHPSLSVGQGADGRVLIHCFAGCDAQAIVNAVGWELNDLFPPDAKDYELPARRQERRSPVNYKGLLFHLRHEVYVLSIAARKMKQGEKFSDDDWATLDRVIKSFERLPNVR